MKWGDNGYFKIRAGTDECTIESRSVVQPLIPQMSHNISTTLDSTSTLEEPGTDPTVWDVDGGNSNVELDDPLVLEAAQFAVDTGIKPFCPLRPLESSEPNMTLASLNPIVFAQRQVIQGLDFDIILQVRS